MTKLIAIIALTVLAGACSKKEGGDKPGEPGYTEAESIELLGKLASVYETAGTDCKKLVADLKSFTIENRDAMRAQNAWRTKLTADEKAALDTKYATELHLAKKMMPAAQACGDDPGLAAALKDLDLQLE
jgi:hypothetical protein